MESTLIQVDNGNKPNEGLQLSRPHVIASHEFDMIGRIHADISFQERYMLNEVGIKVQLVRSKDAFCLMGEMPNDTKLEITHAALFI